LARIEKERKNGMKKLMMILALAVVAGASGCAVVKGRAGDSSYVGWAFGEKASTTLAGLNITETQTVDGIVERGVGVDSSGASSETKLTEVLGKVLMAGIAAYTGNANAVKPVAESKADCKDGDCPE